MAQRILEFDRIGAAFGSADGDVGGTDRGKRAEGVLHCFGGRVVGKASGERNAANAGGRI